LYADVFVDLMDVLLISELQARFAARPFKGKRPDFTDAPGLAPNGFSQACSTTLMGAIPGESLLISGVECAPAL
jgi:hypothetical protein